MGIHENASSSSLRVESNLSAPFNVFQQIEKKKTTHELSGLYQIPRVEDVLNFFSIREKKKARVKLRQNERFSVFFPPIVDLFDLSKSVPQGWLAHFGKTHTGIICD